MDNIESIASKFKNFIDLQKFCDKQHRLIVDLQKQIAEIQKENVFLKLKVADLPQQTESSEQLIAKSTDEETICRTQLKLFRDAALVRELNMEETKKVEVFAKLLLSLSEKKKDKEVKTDTLSNAELMSLVNEPHTKTS